MERSGGASFGGRDGGLWGRWQFMKTRGFLTQGFAISDSLSWHGERSYKERPRKGRGHNQDHKEWETPRFGEPP